MHLTVLVDNNTYIDQYFLGEPAVCYLIEDAGRKILFDTGYSDAFIYNGQKMGIDFTALNTVVLSHGHDDHTRGLQFLMEETDMHSIDIICHPHVFNKKYYNNTDISCPLSMDFVAEKVNLAVSKVPVKISENIIFLGEIPLCDIGEERCAIGVQVEGGSLKPDLLFDDTAMVYKSTDGLFIITGCSHSGIRNICEYAKKVFKCDKISGIIGGFHLMELNENALKTIAYFKDNNIEKLYPCHCVPFKVKAAIDKVIPIGEVGVGLKLEII